MTERNAFLSIVRLGIGHIGFERLDNVNWQDIQALANKQGLAAIFIDGIEKVSESERPPKPILLQWIGETLQGYEYRYRQYCQAISELAGWYAEHGFNMMVLKGFACSLNWPKPDHRPCGDIDIWLYGRQKQADELISQQLGVKVDFDRHHHTVFEWHGYKVENHFDFVNIHSHHSNKEIEKIFKELGKNDSYFENLYGEKVFLPSPNLHALFILRHALSHFASIGITLRQVLDWAFYVEHHTKEIDWAWFMDVLEDFHMMVFFNCINAICVEDLGFDPRIFPLVQFEPRLKDQVLNDILEPEFESHPKLNLIPRLVFKYRRWRGNAWKRKMCFDEKHLENFMIGVWSHLIRPKSI